MNVKDSDLKKTQHSITPPQTGIFSIANQLRYGLALLVVLILLITAGGLILLAYQAQEKVLAVAQGERSRAAAGEINAYVDDLQRKLAYLARVQGLADFTPQTQKKLLDGLSRHNDAYEIIAILDDTGQVVAVVSPQNKNLPKNFANSPLFLRAYKQREDYIGPVEQDPTTGLPEVTLAVPIRNQQDEVGGVLLAQINLKFLWFIVSQTEVGDTGYAYVLDNRNFLIAEKGSSAETFKLQDVSDQPFIQNLTSGNFNPSKSYPGLRGQEVLGAIAPVRSLHWNVVVELPTSEAHAPIIQMLLVMGIVLGIAVLVMVGLGIYFSWLIVQPLQRLTEASARISAGDMDTQVNVHRRNEIGILATTFNQMTRQLKDLYTTLEQRVASRTRRLEVAAMLGERLNSILNLQEILSEVVNQVKNNFDYYYAHIYLLDNKREKLVVAEGTGEAGAEMKAKGHSIPLDAPTSLVARAARTGEIVKIDDVREAKDWLANPLLPNTYSEMAVPIIIEGQVVGILDVQQDKVAGLDEGDANLLRTLANQAAVAIRNARQFAEVQAALAEAHALQQRYIAQSWDKARVAKKNVGRVQFSLGESTTLNEAVIAEARQQALASQDLKLVSFSNSSTSHALVAPITLRNIPIGDLQLHHIEPDRVWTEGELALIYAVIDQVAQAAENLRLLDETQERASRQELISQISNKMRRAPDIETLMKVTVAELFRALEPARTFVHLGSKATSNLQPSGANIMEDGNA